MFSVHQKRAIAEALQGILRATDHPELPTGEIQFKLHVDGAHPSSWADIQNNGAVTHPGVNPHNEAMAMIADIAEGSTTANSLPHIAKIARSALGGDPAFEAWWDRYWVEGKFHEGVRKELALAAWKEALTVMTKEAWAAERERVIHALERYGVPRDRMRGHPSLGIDVLVTRMERESHAVHAERDQLREGLGDLLTAIENWKKMSPLYGAGGGDDGVGTQTQQAGA